MIMSELGIAILHGAPVHVVLLSTPHRLSLADSPVAKSRPSFPTLPEISSSVCPFSLSSIPVLSLLLSSIMITMRVLVYALYLLNLSHSLYLSISYFLPLRQFFRACNGEIFAAHDVYNLSRR